MDPPCLRFFTSKTKTRLVPGKKYTLDARFNDTEIPHGVREDHVPLLVPSLDYKCVDPSLDYKCVDPPWLRSVTSKTITKLGPGKKYTLNSRLNYAEIPNGVREEHVTR